MMSRLIVHPWVPAALVLASQLIWAESVHPLNGNHNLLSVNDSRGHSVYGYEIQPVATLKHQRYYWLHKTNTAADSEADEGTVAIQPKLLEL